MFGKKKPQQQNEAPEVLNKENLFNDIGINNSQAPAGELSNTQEQAYAKLMDKLTHHNTDVIKLLTEMDKEQVMLCTNLLIQSKEFDCPLVENFVYTFMRNNVSNGRKGRIELKEIIQAIRDSERQKSWMQRLHLMPRNQAL